MNFYHGTTIDSAIKILQEKKLRGRKVLAKHQHAYVSFTPQIEMAHEFGLVILEFQNIESQLIEIQDSKWDWVKNNIELYEYIYDDEECDDIDSLKIEEYSDGDKSIEPYEYVAIEELPFTPSQVKVLVCGGQVEEQKETFEVLSKLFSNEYQIVDAHDITLNYVEKQCLEYREKLLNIYRYENFGIEA